VLYEIWGPAVAEDFFHGFSGWFIFMFGMAVLLLEMWVMNGFKSNMLAHGARRTVQGKEKQDTEISGGEEENNSQEDSPTVAPHREG